MNKTDIAKKQALAITAGVPYRYIKADFNSPLNENQKELYSKSLDALKVGKDVLIIGGVGTGKTHMVSSIINLFIEYEYDEIKDRKQDSIKNDILYITEYAMVELYVQKKFSDFELLSNCSLLIIDEVGKFEVEDWKMKHIEETLSNRYNNEYSTIFVTNLSTKDFKDHYGDRLSDRFRDDGMEIVVMDGDSLRGMEDNLDE